MSHGAPAPESSPATEQRRRRRQDRVALGLVAAALVVLVGLFAWVSLGCPCLKPSPTPIDGVVIGVQAASLGDITGFQLRTPGGTVYAFKLGTLQNATEFSPSHLAEHQATSLPIRVWYLDQDGQRVVYRLEDASGASPAAT